MAFSLESTLYSLPAVVAGLTVHEYSHAFAAYRLGDSTAREEGRLSLNPLRHIDPVGFILIVIAGFGWAKPVMFHRECLRRPRRDESIIAVAGPLANLVLGVLGSAALRLLILADPAVTTHLAGAVVFKLLLYLVYINYGLFVFNLIPIPPLDGSHAAFSALRIKPETEARLYRYGSLALLVLIIGSNQLGIDFLWMGSIVHAIARAVFGLLGF